MSEPATAPAPAGVLGQRQAMARRGGWLPWSSVRNLIIFGFALLALALAFVTIAGAYRPQDTGQNSSNWSFTPRGPR